MVKGSWDGLNSIGQAGRLWQAAAGKRGCECVRKAQQPQNGQCGGREVERSHQNRPARRVHSEANGTALPLRSLLPQRTTAHVLNQQANICSNNQRIRQPSVSPLEKQSYIIVKPLGSATKTHSLVGSRTTVCPPNTTYIPTTPVLAPTASAPPPHFLMGPARPVTCRQANVARANTGQPVAMCHFQVVGKRFLVCFWSE